MRVPEEPACIHLFRKNTVFISLHLKSPVHVVPPQLFLPCFHQLMTSLVKLSNTRRFPRGLFVPLCAIRPRMFPPPPPKKKKLSVNGSDCMSPEAGVLDEPYSGKPAQQSCHTGPPGSDGQTP
jgi:hypothetical protein